MILHVDMDAFYAAVEIRERPELASQPVIVGGKSDGRGVVCAANYIARDFGVHSAQPTATAARLCPHGVFLPPRMKFYADVSAKIREIFLRFTPIVEPLSLDEAFLDVTGSELLFGSATEIGQSIKAAIFDELNLVASVGVAPNKFLAKVASDLHKPDGFVVVDKNDIQSFLDPLPLHRIWGVGPKTEARLKSLGLNQVTDVRRLTLESLQQIVGCQQGRQLWLLAHGEDERRVVPDRQAKSLSHESTFSADIKDSDALRAWTWELADQVARRLRRNQLLAKSAQLKLRYHDFTTVQQASKLTTPTSSTREIASTGLSLLKSMREGRGDAVRLLGVGVTVVEQSAAECQRMLFADDEAKSTEQLDAATDGIRDRFGADALMRAASLLLSERSSKEKPPRQ